jgi:hypothetical protein
MGVQKSLFAAQKSFYDNSKASGSTANPKLALQAQTGYPDAPTLMTFSDVGKIACVGGRVNVRILSSLAVFDKACSDMLRSVPFLGWPSSVGAGKGRKESGEGIARGEIEPLQDVNAKRNPRTASGVRADIRLFISLFARWVGLGELENRTGPVQEVSWPEGWSLTPAFDLTQPVC